MKHDASAIPHIYLLILRFNYDIDEIYKESLKDKHYNKWGGGWIKIGQLLEPHMSWRRKEKIKFKARWTSNEGRV